MKKIFAILLILPFIYSCSSDDAELENLIDEEQQDYTSFIFETPDATWYVLENCIAGFYTKDGDCIKIADLGNLDSKNPSKEITITIDTLVNVYLFADIAGTVRMNDVFKLKKNHKNSFKLKPKTSGIEVNKNDPKQYPH